MSCSTCGGFFGCGCSQPPACNYNVTVVNSTSTAVTGAVNANIAGVGVFDALDNGVLYFRGVESADSTYLSVSLNATNHTVLLTFDVNALAAALPQATTTQAGIGETATDAEAQGKASTTVFLTPSNLAALGASTTFSGLVELATDAETQAGLSTTLAVTPAGLQSVVDTLGTTEVFGDAVARLAATPAFNGQYCVQIDNPDAFISSDTLPGSFNIPVFIGGSANQLNAATYITLGDHDFIFSGGGVGAVLIQSDFAFDTTSSVTVKNYFDFSSTARIYDQGVQVPASSVLTTSTTSGQFNSKLINTFVSTDNTQTGYTTFSNPSTLRTCDTATVTLQQLAQLVGTLIEDLKAVNLPAT